MEGRDNKDKFHRKNEWNLSEDDLDEENKRKTNTVESEARKKKFRKKRKKLQAEGNSSISSVNEKVEQIVTMADVHSDEKINETLLLESMIERLEQSLDDKDKQLYNLKRRIVKLKEDKEKWKDKYDELQYSLYADDSDSNDDKGREGKDIMRNDDKGREGKEITRKKIMKQEKTKHKPIQRPKLLIPDDSWFREPPPRNPKGTISTPWPTAEEINRRRMKKIRKPSNLLEGDSRDKFILPALNTVQPMIRQYIDCTEPIEKFTVPREKYNAAKKTNNQQKKSLQSIRLPKLK